MIYLFYSITVPLWTELVILIDQIQIMMRNEIQRQKQLCTHKQMSVDSSTQPSVLEHAPIYSDHKSICYIQLTDYSESGCREENPSFRTTFFSKIGKRASPKKNFYKTMTKKFQEEVSQLKIKRRKSEKDEQKSAIVRQYSQRSNFIIKKLNEAIKIGDQANAKDGMKIKKQKSEIQDSQTGLIQDIERLRYSQNGYLHMLKDKSFLSNTNIVNLQMEDEPVKKKLIEVENNGDLMESQTRQAKEEACLRLREKIKNKQSRKHIYHSLKNKCDAWNKIRLKTQQFFNSKERTSAIQECQSTRLHCKKVANHPPNIQAIIIKPTFKPVFENTNPLKIVSKPCTISINSFPKSSVVQSSLKQMFLASQGNPESPGFMPNRSKREAYQDIIASISKNKKECAFGRCHTGQKYQQRNQFRLLTPWKADNEETF